MIASITLMLQWSFISWYISVCLDIHVDQQYFVFVLTLKIITANSVRCQNLTNVYIFYSKGDVLLNQTCKHSDQCSTSPYAACLEGRCKCIDGYKARNDSFCEKGKRSSCLFCIYTSTVLVIDSPNFIWIWKMFYYYLTHTLIKIKWITCTLGFNLKLFLNIPKVFWIVKTLLRRK